MKSYLEKRACGKMFPGLKGPKFTILAFTQKIKLGGNQALHHLYCTKHACDSFHVEIYPWLQGCLSTAPCTDS